MIILENKHLYTKVEQLDSEGTNNLEFDINNWKLNHPEWKIEDISVTSFKKDDAPFDNSIRAIILYTEGVTVTNAINAFYGNSYFDSFILEDFNKFMDNARSGGPKSSYDYQEWEKNCNYARSYINGNFSEYYDTSIAERLAFINSIKDDYAKKLIKQAIV